MIFERIIFRRTSAEISLIIEKRYFERKTFWRAKRARNFLGLFWGDFAGFEYIFHVPGPGFEC